MWINSNNLIAGSILMKLHDDYDKVFLKCSSLSPIQKIIKDIRHFTPWFYQNQDLSFANIPCKKRCSKLWFCDVAFLIACKWVDWIVFTIIEENLYAEHKQWRLAPHATFYFSPFMKIKWRIGASNKNRINMC